MHTKQLSTVSPRDSHQLLFATRVKGQIRCDVINLAIEGGPSIVRFIVLLQFRRLDASKIVDASLSMRNS